MRFTPGFFGSLLTGAGKWEIRLDKSDLCICSNGSHESKIDYPSIIEVGVTPGLVWADVKLRASGQSFDFGGIANNDANLLKETLDRQITRSLSRKLDENAQSVHWLVRDMDEFLALPKYLAQRDIAQWTHRIESKETGEPTQTVLSVLRHPYANLDLLPPEMQAGAGMLFGIMSGRLEVLAQRNRRFVEGELLAHRAFFDTVENTPLTQEQRIASIVMDDRNLLVAAAGSGKTSTVVGKVGYALRTGLAAPHEILVLAFNNAAAGELDDRIKGRLGGHLAGRMVKVKTFHALGVEVIAEATGKKPSVANFASGGEIIDGQLMSELVEYLLASDPDFAARWLLFLLVCRKQAKDPAEFESVRDWQAYVNATGDYRDGQSGYLTLNGELVKSQGELAIANWLFMNSVGYQYERPYQYETADREYRQYKPDFYFPAIDCYLEHYALDANGNPPAAFGAKYRASMDWKRRLHEEKRTDVFETTFAEFAAGTLFDMLGQNLAKRGVKLKPRSRQEILERLNQPRIGADLGSLLRTFIKHAKSNELGAAQLAARAEAAPHPHRAGLFASLASKVMAAYEEKLKALGEVDFEDLIVEAARLSASGQFSHPYKLILVDEFQDISRARAKLLLSFLDKAPDCKLFAVGDDWQSVYRFAGADIAIFTGFQRIFGPTATHYLTKTFRSNQGIADAAAEFVQRNPGQMRKTPVAQDRTAENVVAIRQYARLQDMEVLVEAALCEADADSTGRQKTAKVFILGRYRNQLPGGLSGWQRRFASNLSIEFKTIHASKGLQADYVILVGLHTRKDAFPSEIADDPLLQMVMPEPEGFPNAEERRLFYVALTRAKHKVWLLGGKHTASCFLTEIQATLPKPPSGASVGTDKQAIAIERCPKCKTGRLTKRHGKYGPFIGCSEYPGCNYTRRI